MSDVTGRFLRSDRLLDSRDFRRILRRGRRAAHRDVVVISTPVDKKHLKSNDLRDPESIGSRLGITASRKVGNAVARNRVKRRIREWFRNDRASLPRDTDWVLIARAGAAELGAPDTQRELRELGAR